MSELVLEELSEQVLPEREPMDCEATSLLKSITNREVSRGNLFLKRALQVGATLLVLSVIALQPGNPLHLASMGRSIMKADPAAVAAAAQAAAQASQAAAKAKDLDAAAAAAQADAKAKKAQMTAAVAAAKADADSAKAKEAMATAQAASQAAANKAAQAVAAAKAANMEARAKQVAAAKAANKVPANALPAAAPAPGAAPAPAAPAATDAKGCHTAVPGDSCFGAVLWHKWIGVVENPGQYGGGINRNSNRFAIQDYLFRTKQAGCQKPCPGAYPVATVAEPAGAKLYCFSVARPGPEMDCMFLQRQTGTGIFACNGYDVYSPQSIDINGYKTKLIPSTAAGVSVDGWAANSQVFMKTWTFILNSNWWYNYDFMAKVDPDAVLFPDRLRWHVAAHVGQNVFFLNCAVHAPAMYGAVEVFSKSALGAYKAAHGRCEGALPFWSWGEDKYLQECLKMLGVAPVADYNNNVRDARCWGSDCGNKGAVAFHAYKTVNSWYRCHLASQ